MNACLGWILVALLSTSLSAQNSLDINLADFKPEVAYQLPRTQVDKARYPVIDMHSHPYAKNQQELDAWVRTMDEVGIDKTVILTYSTGERFDSLYDFYMQYPDRFVMYCGFDYTGHDQPGFGPAAVRELRRCHAKGARGVGELGDKGKGLFYSRPSRGYGMHISDDRMDPLLAECARLGMPVSVHVAEPIWMYLDMDETNDGLMNAFKWRLDNQEGILDHQQMIGTLETAVRKHPATTFVACHYANCSYDLSILGRLFDRYPNLYADISARFAEVSPIPRHVKRFFAKYAKRLVYGSDMGMRPAMYRTTFRILESEDEHFYARDYFSYHWPLHGLALPDKVLKRVYTKNAWDLIPRH